MTMRKMQAQTWRGPYTKMTVLAEWDWHCPNSTAIKRVKTRGGLKVEVCD